MRVDVAAEPRALRAMAMFGPYTRSDMATRTRTRSPMRLRHVEIFHAIKRSGSISRAAELLFISQPAVSQALKQTEAQLGFKLFKLERGRLQPTPEAEMLADAVEKVFQEVDALQQVAMNLQRGATGRLRIACLPAFGLNLLPLAVANHRRSYPGVAIEVGTRHSSELYRSLLMHEFDLGVGFATEAEESAPAGLAAVTIGWCELVFIDRAERGASKRPERSIRLVEINLERFIGLSTEPSSNILGAAFEENHLHSAPLLQVQTYYIARSLVSAGAGCAIVDEFTARAPPVGDIVIRRLNPAIRVRVNVYRSAFHPTGESVEHFIEHLDSAYKSLMAPS
jgi:DNA-binding transcriptional LysR family regulator